MVHVPAVVAPIFLGMDARQDVIEEGGGLHRNLDPLEGEEFRILQDVVDPLQLGQLDVVLQGEGVKSVTELG